MRIRLHRRREPFPRLASEAEYGTAGVLGVADQHRVEDVATSVQLPPLLRCNYSSASSCLPSFLSYLHDHVPGRHVGQRLGPQVIERPRQPG